MTQKKDQASPLIEVKLAKPHTHKGKQYKPGDKIQVNAIELAFLRKAEVVAEEAGQ
jgi:hypothetical protein